MNKIIVISAAKAAAIRTTANAAVVSGTFAAAAAAKEAQNKAARAALYAEFVRTAPAVSAGGRYNTMARAEREHAVKKFQEELAKLV